MANLITLKDISFCYNPGKNNEVTAINGLSLTIEEGEFVGIVGTSGAGKSTLLHILAGILTPSGGVYPYKGEDMSGKSPKQIARLRNAEFGFILQDFGLIGNSTGLENVCLPLMFSKEPWRNIEKKGTEVMDKLGIEHLKGRKVNEMSGGECQRVAIARALVHKPSIIFADEPTGALDVNNTRFFMNQLAEINKEGVSIILVTHDVNTLTSCERVIELSDGRIIKGGE